MSLSTRFVIYRARRATWRAARKRRRDLERELSEYTTPAQRADLLATFARYPDGCTNELRDILTSQQLASKPGHWPAMEGR